MQLAVIICTHNPRSDYLQRVLESLRRQTLPTSLWELLLIDNRSNEPLSAKWDISWHPNARHLCEEALGLTFARLRGISEARTDLLIFVDDDNVLDDSYLSVAIDLAEKHPWIGAFGGSTCGEFESPPGDEIKLMLPELAVREISKASWACMPGVDALGTAPCGAGMVIRRSVAQKYASMIQNDRLRMSFDRRGSSLASAGDSDMALTACDLELAVGVFPELSLTHLIPAFRLEHAYLLRLAEEMRKSHVLLHYVRNGRVPDWARLPRSSGLLRTPRSWIRRCGKRILRRKTFQDKYVEANFRGIASALESISNLSLSAL